MDMTVGIAGQNVDVKVGGRCTFSDYNAFQEIMTCARDGGAQAITIRMDELEFVDSSGLGMLLMLRDKSAVPVTLSSPQGQVKKMLEVAQLGKIFTIID